MFQFTSAVKIFLCAYPINMHFSFEGLSGLVESLFNQDPTCGHIFVFYNKRKDKIKLLYFDNDGLAIWYKRLERGTFKFPVPTNESSLKMDIATLTLILSGFEPTSVRRLHRFKIKENQRRTA
jgi:transposase